jgi:hypothetical protein
MVTGAAGSQAGDDRVDVRDGKCDASLPPESLCLQAFPRSVAFAARLLPEIVLR